MTLAAFLLSRIKYNPRLAYYFDPLTESMERLTAQCAEEKGIHLEEFRKGYYATLKFEPPVKADELLNALRSVVAIADECAREWDGDNDMRVGKILLALAGTNRGYRADIDAIHAAIAKAEGRP
jgi:hypothetical protein